MHGTLIANAPERITFCPRWLVECAAGLPGLPGSWESTDPPAGSLGSAAFLSPHVCPSRRGVGRHASGEGGEGGEHC